MSDHSHRFSEAAGGPPIYVPGSAASTPSTVSDPQVPIHQLSSEVGPAVEGAVGASNVLPVVVGAVLHRRRRLAARDVGEGELPMTVVRHSLTIEHSQGRLGQFQF